MTKSVFAGDSSTYFVDAAGQTLKVLVQNSGDDIFDNGAEVVLRWSADSTVRVDETS